MSDYPSKMRDFMHAADYADAGDAALLSVCGVSLGDRVRQFLGDGEWDPKRVYDEPSKDPAGEPQT